ncbi:MAG: hypothetical protein NVSMB63_08090 [Sediminibacterium sp.]
MYCFFWGISFFTGIYSFAADNRSDTIPRSTLAEATAFIEKIKELPSSSYWPNVKPALFLENIRNNIYHPFSMYEGRNTNFCAYAALSYLPLHNDPLGFAKFMLELYQQGHAGMGAVFIDPSPEVKLAAGKLQFKGELDIRPADQMWFLSLADHFKGYLNIFDRHFDMGDENKIWAAVNFAKFNRMIRKLFNYKVDAEGSDLIRPGIADLYDYLKERSKTGILALFVNNVYLYKKNHRKIKVGVPTHFIILLGLEEIAEDKINMIYWDYGGRSLQQVTPAFLKKIIFGIAHITEKKANAE